MKCKVVSVEKVTFKNGSESNKVFAMTEDQKMGCFYTRSDCKVGSIFELGIGTDNQNRFCVTKTFVG